MSNLDQIKYRKKQKRWFLWTIIAVVLFVIAWSAGIYRHLFGFNPQWAGDNFVFNMSLLFPATIFSSLVCYFTAGLTILHWKSMPSKKISVLTVLLSLSLLLYVGYSFLMVLRK